MIALPTMQRLPPDLPILGGTVAFEAIFLARMNTAAVNLAGNPAIAIPIPVQDREVPKTSLQLIGRNRGEAELVNAARLLAEN
jgi:amidase